MRYWILTTELYPRFGGGIGTYVHETAQALGSRGHDVLVMLADWASATRLEYSSPGHYRLATFSPLEWSSEAGLGDVARLSHAFSNLFRDLVAEHGAPDYVESQEYLGIPYFILQRQLVLEPGYPKVPVLLRAHCPSFAYSRANGEPQYRLPSFWTGEMERFSLRAASAVLSPNAYTDDLVRADVPGANLIRVPNPLDLPPENEAGHSGDFVYFARIQAIKGIIELLAAFERRFDRGELDPISIYGASTEYVERNCDLRQFLERKHAASIEAGLINFHGYLRREVAHQRLREAKAVLVPTRLETFCYGAAESMSLGRVMVASRNGGQVDYIEDGVNGLLIADDSDAALDDALDRAAALTTTERQQLGKAARETVLQFQPNAVVDSLLEALKAVPNGPSRDFPVVRPRIQLAPTTAAAKEGRTKLLSVVVPAYNMGEMLAEAVDSLILSSYRPLEIVVVNDGSDDPASLACLYQLRVPAGAGVELRVIHQRNRGLALTRNIGAAAATGEFLSFLDGDDLVERDYYSRAIAVLQEYDNVGFVGCWLRYFGDNDTSWLTWNPEPPFLLYHNLINSASIVCRRELYLEHGQNDPRYNVGMEDYAAVIQMVAAGVPGVALPERLFRYRVRSDSMMRGFNNANQMLMYERLAQLNQQFYSEYAVELTGLLNANGPGWAYDNPTWATGWKR